MSTTNVALAIGGQTRHFTLHVPATLKPGQKLVIAFHPAIRPSANGLFNGWAQYPGQTFLGTSEVGKYSDLEGFICAFPSAMVNVGGVYNWNYWQDGGAAEFPSPLPDDVAFTLALIKLLFSQYAINPKAVHIEGFSGGAMFTYWFAQKHPELLASFAIMEGEMIQPLRSSAGPVSGIIFAGQNDWTMGYCSNVHTGSTVQQILDYWAAALGLPSPAQLCPLAGADSAFATDGHHDLQFYKVLNGGHARYLNDLSVQAFDSTGHPLPYAPALAGKGPAYETALINRFQDTHLQP